MAVIRTVSKLTDTHVPPRRELLLVTGLIGDPIPCPLFQCHSLGPQSRETFWLTCSSVSGIEAKVVHIGVMRPQFPSRDYLGPSQWVYVLSSCSWLPLLALCCLNTDKSVTVQLLPLTALQPFTYVAAVLPLFPLFWFSLDGQQDLGIGDDGYGTKTCSKLVQECFLISVYLKPLTSTACLHAALIGFVLLLRCKDGLLNSRFGGNFGFGSPPVCFIVIEHMPFIILFLNKYIYIHLIFFYVLFFQEFLF